MNIVACKQAEGVVVQPGDEGDFCPQAQFDETVSAEERARQVELAKCVTPRTCLMRVRRLTMVLAR